jgi:pSer/pThr/pTyr-binding forkhead associated (FHA) protein
MTCTTCGRENPPHLTFCQECGQRLGPRIAPPTPPIGLGSADAYGAPPNVGDTHRDARDSRGLPPRVATSLGMIGSPAEPVPAAAHAGGERRCKICDTINGPNLRYCTSCGSTLEAGPAPPGAQAQGPNAIAPMRVVDLGTNKPADGVRTCSRCRGTAEGSAQFCKFCGASLADPAPAPAPALDALRPNGTLLGAEEQKSPAARGPTAPLGQVGFQAGRPAPMGHAPPPVASPSPIGPAAPQPVSSYGAIPQPSGASALAAAIPRPASAPPPAPHHSRPPAPVAGPQRGRLVVIAKSGADGPSYPFGDLLDIGRLEGNVVVAEDPYLSPRHVRILWNGGKLVLRDLASTNGVYLRLAPSRDTTPRRTADNPEVAVPLQDHDFILVGQQVLRFDILREGEGGFGPAQEHGTLLFGSPAAPRYARLCQRTVEGIARDIYYVRKLETVLGRESGDVVFTEDPFLSRRHAAIRLLSRDGSLNSQASSPGGSRPPLEPRFALVDLGSSNGTFLRIRGDVELAPGDHFRVGQQLFRVDFDGPRGVGG